MSSCENFSTQTHFEIDKSLDCQKCTEIWERSCDGTADSAIFQWEKFANLKNNDDNKNANFH